MKNIITIVCIITCCLQSQITVYSLPEEGIDVNEQQEERNTAEERAQEERENRDQAAALDSIRRQSQKQNEQAAPSKTLAPEPIHQQVLNSIYDAGATFSGWFSSGIETAKTTASSWIGRDRTTENTAPEDKTLKETDAAIPQETEAQRLQRRSNGFADPMSIDNNIIDLEAQLEAIKTDPTSSSFFESFLQKARDVQMRFTKSLSENSNNLEIMNCSRKLTQG
jgi:hypothetical protein